MKSIIKGLINLESRCRICNSKAYLHRRERDYVESLLGKYIGGPHERIIRVCKVCDKDIRSAREQVLNGVIDDGEKMFVVSESKRVL